MSLKLPHIKLPPIATIEANLAKAHELAKKAEAIAPAVIAAAPLDATHKAAATAALAAAVTTTKVIDAATSVLSDETRAKLMEANALAMAKDPSK